jgi:hypothetical protein
MIAWAVAVRLILSKENELSYQNSFRPMARFAINVSIEEDG